MADTPTSSSLSALHTGSTHTTSPLSSLSGDLDPLPTKAPSKRPLEESSITKTKRPKAEDKGTYCHQCRRKCEPDNVLRCTKPKSFTKNTAVRACNLAFCDTDLTRHYGFKPDQLRSTMSSSTNTWVCPCCADRCLSSRCRRKTSLKPIGFKGGLGNSQKSYAVKSSNPTNSAPHSKLSTTSPKNKTPKFDPSKQNFSKTGSSKSTEAEHAGPSKFTHKKKAEPIVAPPVFDKVDTRLTLVEADHRFGLREFLVRFRAALGLSERCLSALDDFDRPLTEANVRLFAGAFLETIRDQVKEDTELHNRLFNYREELRYYADLARFASIYNAVRSPLGLRPATCIPNPYGYHSDSSSPDYARRGASKTPSPAEVIAMLLSLADRAIATPRLRGDLEAIAENEARKDHVQLQRKENGAWEANERKFTEAMVQCQTPAETKAIKIKFAQEQRDHDLRISLINVNLRAELSRQAPRRTILGTDLDGRIYYMLSARSLNDDSRPPIGWASGLLIFGTTNADGNIQDPQWSHFGKSEDVKHLAKWIEWRYSMVVCTPQRSIPSGKNSKTTSIEVVIPLSRHKTSRSDSSLSSAPSSVPEHGQFSSLLNPEGYYKPSPTVAIEEGRDLVSKLREVAEWLAVLEWKGLGEV